MGGSYRQCDECGKRALSIATRCPGCGREFLAPPAVERPRGRSVRYLSPASAGALAIAVLTVVAAIDLGAPSVDRPPQVVASDSVDSSVVGYAPEMPRLETESAAAIARASTVEVLVARDWTNVRKSRSRRADLEAILTPGDTVVADSLQRDWYRVALEGEVLGYAHRSTLVAPAAHVLEGRAGT